MGGSGSTRWNNHNKKTTTEECWTLDVLRFSLHKPVSYPLCGSLGAIRIKDRRTLQVRYSLAEEEHTPVLNLSYSTTTGRGLPRRECKERVQLLTTEPNFGEVRWWFSCPFRVDDGEQQCGRRVGKLYLPAGKHCFGCRKCHDLTYKSSQESHIYDNIYALIAGEASGEASEAVKEVISDQRRAARKQKMRAPTGMLGAFDRAFG